MSSSSQGIVVDGVQVEIAPWRSELVHFCSCTARHIALVSLHVIFLLLFYFLAFAKIILNVKITSKLTCFAVINEDCSQSYAQEVIHNYKC
jgi:hypothetical protein